MKARILALLAVAIATTVANVSFSASAATTASPLELAKQAKAKDDSALASAEATVTAARAADVAAGEVVASLEAAPKEEPPKEEPKTGAVTLRADGEKGGPTNDPLGTGEMMGYSGAESTTGNKHPRIELVKETEGVKAPQGSYMYRFDLKPGRSYWDNERLELLNEQMPYDPVSPITPSKVQYGEGRDLWLAFQAYVPMVGTPEVPDCEICHPNIWQFHGKGSAVPTTGAGIKGTKAGETPRIFSWVGGSHSWEEPLRLKQWYRFVYHIHVSSSSSTGRVEVWEAAEGQPLALRQNVAYATRDAEWMFSCMGGPRNEKTLADSPPEQIWEMDGWTEGTSREAVTLNAFGSSQ
jgi:hypothetical protein